METNNPKNASENEVEIDSAEPTENSAEAGGTKNELEAARQEILYARAELENYKRRILKDTDQSIKLANRSLITELLNVLDLFERAVGHTDGLKAKGDADVSNFVSGIEMTRNELVNLLTRFGVEFLGKAGEKFDPNTQEAIAQVEGPDAKVGTVLEVHQKGALLNGKLLKAARVVVGTAKAS